jgi:hypothetical protein
MKLLTTITAILLLSAASFSQTTIKVTTSSSSSAKTVYTQAGTDALVNKAQSNAVAYTNAQVLPVWVWIAKTDSIINALNAVTVKQQADIDNLKFQNRQKDTLIAMMAIDYRSRIDAILPDTIINGNGFKIETVGPRKMKITAQVSYDANGKLVKNY